MAVRAQLHSRTLASALRRWLDGHKVQSYERRVLAGQRCAALHARAVCALPFQALWLYARCRVLVRDRSYALLLLPEAHPPTAALGTPWNTLEQLKTPHDPLQHRTAPDHPMPPPSQPITGARAAAAAAGARQGAAQVRASPLRGAGGGQGQPDSQPDAVRSGGSTPPCNRTEKRPHGRDPTPRRQGCVPRLQPGVPMSQP